ncbi:MAG: hypothetical protein ABR573_10970 [Candidatus Dormibacteria bacterium]
MTVFMIAGPVILGLYGLVLLFNIFGTADREVEFHRGRGDLHPILDGDQQLTHRLVGGVLLLFGVVMSWAFIQMGLI